MISNLHGLPKKMIKEVMIFLQGNGVSTTYAVKIFKQYGEQAIEVVSTQSLSTGCRYLRHRFCDR